MYNATIGFRNFGGRPSEHRLAPVAEDDIIFNEELFMRLFEALDFKEQELHADSSVVSAVVGVASGDQVIELLTKYRWLDRRPLLEPELEFLNGKLGDPAIDD